MSSREVFSSSSSFASNQDAKQPLLASSSQPQLANNNNNDNNQQDAHHQNSQVESSKNYNSVEMKKTQEQQPIQTEEEKKENPERARAQKGEESKEEKKEQKKEQQQQRQDELTKKEQEPVLLSASSKSTDSSLNNIINPDNLDSELNALLARQLRCDVDLCCGLSLSPAVSFVIQNLLFYLPLIFSCLKPIFFLPKVNDFVNFDWCGYISNDNNSSSSNVTNDNNISLVSMPYLDCLICRNGDPKISLNPDVHSFYTTAGTTWIIVRLSICAAIFTWLYSRVLFERFLSVRLLAFRIFTPRPPLRTILPDMLLALVISAAISAQLAFLKAFEPDNQGYVNAGRCGENSSSSSSSSEEMIKPSDLFFNKTFYLFVNRSSLDSAYHVETGKSELFSFLTILVIFVIGPIVKMFQRFWYPYAMLNALFRGNRIPRRLAFLSPQTTKDQLFDVSDGNYGSSSKNDSSNSEEKNKNNINNNSNSNLRRIHIARRPMIKQVCFLLSKRGVCAGLRELVFAATPIPITYVMRVLAMENSIAAAAPFYASPSSFAKEKGASCCSLWCFCCCCCCPSVCASSSSSSSSENNSDGIEDEEVEANDDPFCVDDYHHASKAKATTTTRKSAEQNIRKTSNSKSSPTAAASSSPSSSSSAVSLNRDDDDDEQQRKKKEAQEEDRETRGRDVNLLTNLDKLLLSSLHAEFGDELGFEFELINDQEYHSASHQRSLWIECIVLLVVICLAAVPMMVPVSPRSTWLGLPEYYS